MLSWSSLLLTCLATPFAPLPIRDDDATGKTATFAVERYKDIAYRTDKDADKVRNAHRCLRAEGTEGFPGASVRSRRTMDDRE